MASHRLGLPARKMVALVLFTLLSATSAAPAAREYGGHYTADKLQNARANCIKFDWAKKMRDDAVAKAKPWIDATDADLWTMVPGQNLPRCIDVTYERNATPQRLGCLECGEKLFAYGNYPYEPDFKNHPWKLICPSCGAVFPTNDFGKYYASGIDVHGLFDPAKADRTLLFNAQHPDPKDPLHTFGVDDGFGYIDAGGHSHKFIAYYAWKYWRHIAEGVTTLADAFAYTGDRIYAHKAAILLDRIADVYPAMDWKPYADRGWFHSDGFSGKGKIEGCIWECGLITSIADAYDKILSGTVDDPSLYAFLAERGRQYSLPSAKGSRDLFVQNVDQNLLRCAFEAVKAHRIWGNQGMHQHTVTTCAIALNTQPDTNQWLDWVFQSNGGGALSQLIVGQLDRDGLSPEGAPQYATLWDTNFAALAMELADYPAYTHHHIFADFPQFAATFTAPYRLAVLGRATPNTGDTSATGEIARPGVNVELMAAGFEYTHRPDVAIAAFRANGMKARGLDRDIYAADPSAIAREIETLGKAAGPRPVEGELLSGFGQATIESPANGGTALSAYYGRSIHHGHADRLNFDLFSLGRWLTPDLGYPEFTGDWPSATNWTRTTLSHNTVVVDGQPQVRDYGGRTELFAQSRNLSAFRIDGGAVYPQCSRYVRTMLLVTTPRAQAYVLDLFQVSGGSEHLYSFHGPPGVVEASGAWSERPGTYAGADVPFEDNSKQFPLGFSYLTHLRQRSEQSVPFDVDWRVDPTYRPPSPSIADSDDHVRLHVLSPITDATLADGQPPQNKAGNPHWLTYALLRRAGHAGLSSTFVTAIEPYQNTPIIRSIRRLDDGAADADHVAVRVELMDGTVDTLLLNFPGCTSQHSGNVVLDGVGAVALVRALPDHSSCGAMIGGTRLSGAGVQLASPGVLSGRVVAMNRELTGGGWIDVDAALPADGSLDGRYICVGGRTERDPCYHIQHISRTAAGTRIDCGPINFINGYVAADTQPSGQTHSPSETASYSYDFAVGDTFAVPLVSTTPASDAGTAHVSD